MRINVAIFFLVLSCQSMAAICNGHFVNPIKDVCWRCLFPLSIGHANVVSHHLPDTDNAASPIGVCPTSIGARVGLNLGYWEPVAMVDVTDSPYCLVNLGGTQLHLGSKVRRGGKQVIQEGEMRAFYHVHWYKYPLIAWLNLITSSGCQQGGDFDIAYMTELDPTWNDSEMAFVLNPEAVLFGNSVAASSCAADSLSSTLRNQAMDSLFWCAGSQGSMYPLTGHVNAPLSPVQAALLLTERMNYKMHREALITDSSAKDSCKEHRLSVLPKSRYRYEMVNQVADGKHCYPSGHTTLDWEIDKIKPHTPGQYGFLVWRKRNCVYL